MTIIKEIASDTPGVNVRVREVLTTVCGRVTTTRKAERVRVPIEVWEASKTPDWTDEYQ